MACLPVPSRLKGMETIGVSTTGRRLWCCSLPVPSRLKGMETFWPSAFLVIKFTCLPVPSRLKGMETRMRQI